ncbi:hypothetical protein BDW22DRAFT_1000165 [Trametopsis cervina]|nr:hypothetical protein BDW22DRAFT_1000165 [Trametopsis cervina]
MYDYAPSSSSRSHSPCGSLVGLTNTLPPPTTSSPSKPRTHSPLPHLSVSTLLPHAHHHAHQHHHHTHSRPYSPSSKRADVSRLLDPSYASSSSSSATTSSAAYVDHRGDLHDPDYRDFPVLPINHNNNNRTPRRAASTGSKDARRTDRYSTYPLVARPEWERDWVEETQFDREEEEGSVEGLWSESPRRASMPVFHSRFPRVYPYTAEPMAVPGLTFSTTSSPVDSLDEEPEAESPFADHQQHHHQPHQQTRQQQKTYASSILRRMRRTGSAGDVLREKEQRERGAMDDEIVETRDRVYEEDEEDEEREDDTEEVLRGMDDVPSCTHALKQQWQALALRLRFGVFHVKRRLSTSRRRRGSA